MSFHPAVATWFARRFAHGPTEAQAQGWPAIAAGENTLIAAPTGSGKTLAAFLVCIDRLYRAAEAAAAERDDAAERAAAAAEHEAAEPIALCTQVVYVSPLKALAVDIEQNLQTPLAEIARVAEELGLRVPDVRVAVRSGDTGSSARAAMLKRPPDILITTPESLYLLLTAERSRDILRGARTVIVDEIHAIARDKRGAHLALTLERLAHVCGGALQRIGLSATQRPIDRVAHLLCGADPGTAEAAATPRPCTIVDTGHRRAIDLAIELPDSELEAVASTEQFAQVLDKIAAHALARRTTLVFVNTRRLAERVAHLLAERVGEERVSAHHGSLSKDRRLRVEQRLRAGDLRVVVATASLELGIDIGPVELVCQIGSPRSIATLLQRVGRSGHSRFGMPVGRLYPLTRDELCECAALLRAVRAGQLDAITMPQAPLDVLAQQIVAECAAEPWNEDALFTLMRGAHHYVNLSRADFDAALELVSEGVLTGRGRRAAYVQRDRVHGQLTGRRGARLSALTSGGAIPEMADYRVIADPDDTFVGTINEDFAIESMVGDVFLLGSTSWRVRRVERGGVVRVVDAKGATPTIPFWLGEAPARTTELSEQVSRLRAEVGDRIAQAGVSAAAQWLQEETAIDAVAAAEIVAYIGATRAALGLVPSQRDVVFERFFDETGGMQLVAHAPFGGRINRALGLLLRKRFCTSFDFELQAAASDDAIVLSLGPQHSFPLQDTPDFLRPARAREALVHAAIATPMFAVRWRWNLNRALVVLRMKGGKKNPPPIQRMESDDVMVAVFPALAACQDNATGPREIPDHVLVRQTLDDCLREAMDIDGLEQLLSEIAGGHVRVHFRDTTEPSPLSHEILNSRPYTFLDDAPLEERRTRAVQLRRGLPVEARELAALDPAAIDRVRGEAAPDPRDAGELLDVLSWLGVLAPEPRWQAWFDELVAVGRGVRALLGGAELWCALEKRAACEVLFPAARFVPDLALPEALAAQPRPEREQAAHDVVRGHLDTLGPVSVPALCAQTALDAETVQGALNQLEIEGLAMRGRFDPRSDDPQWCARRLLGRIHRYTQERLRRDIEPVSARDFTRFLLRWQHVEPGSQVQGQAGLLAVIAQLQGFELAAGAWERNVLAARVEGYRPEWLDGLCLSGHVTWGRISRPAVRAEAGEPLRAAAPAGIARSVSRATPITIAIRSDFAWLARGRGDGETREPLEPATAKVLDCLRDRGALFFAELRACSGLSEEALQDALWDGVARGLVTADGFAALRSLLAPPRWARARDADSRRFGLRRGARGGPSGEGRWALVTLPEREPAIEADPDALAEAVVEQLLARWGVVFRDLLARESLPVSWRDAIWALRRLEARGLVRGGRFVSGFSGEQYALPDAVDLLRSMRRKDRDRDAGSVVRVNGCDPLNLAGILMPGARVPAVRTQSVAYRDGVLVEDAAAADASAASAIAVS